MKIARSFVVLSLPALACSFSVVGNNQAPAFARGVCHHNHRRMRMVLADAATEGASADVVVKRLPDSAVEIQIPVPGPATKAAYDKVCTELSKTVQIPGFRKGSKIPPQVLEQAMSAKGGRNALKIQAINELMTQLVEPTLKQQSLDPIGQANLQVTVEELAESFKPGQEFTLPVQCDVWPEIHWKTIEGQDKPYEGLKGKYQRKPFNQERMDKALNDLRERYATLETIDDPNHVLEMGDACIVNMNGFLANEDGTKGEPLPSGVASGDRVEVILGTGRYMEGLVEGILGAKVGDTRTVNVAFPEKLRDKSLAGKKAIFDVEVIEASRRTIPEITDEFAAKVRPGLTAEALHEELRKAIDSEDKKEFVPARNKALGEALAQVMEVEVPDTLITNQAREKFAVMMAEMRDNGVPDEEIKKQINPENFLKYKNIVKDSIIRDFKISMATDEIARLENINVPDYQVQEQLENIKKDAAENKEEYDEGMIRAKVETTLQRAAVMDWLEERAQLEVEYTDDEFDEQLMQQLAEESLERERKIAEEGKTIEEAALETKAAVATPVVEEVQDAVVVEEEEEAAAPTAAAEPAQASETEEERAARYAAMSVEERAYQILKDTGALDK